MAKFETRRYRRLALGGLVASFLVVPVWAASLEPNWLEVRVIGGQAGGALADAAVCLGTQARPDQIGARRSDGRGVVRFEDIGAQPLLLTVSGKGYQGRQQAVEPLYNNRVIVVKLVNGGGGPVCDAPPPAQSAAQGSGIELEAVRVRANINAGSAGGVLVSARSSAPVNQIRISEHPDFKGADWQPYKFEVPVVLSAGKGVKTLYVQVRRAAERKGASIAVVSQVKKVSYRAD